MSVLDVLAEVFTWAGFGLAVIAGAFALILLLLDGTWLPVTGYVESGPTGRVVRWVDVDGIVHDAAVTPEQDPEIGDSDQVVLYSRRGYRGQMRLHRTSHAVRAAGLFALGLAGLGLVAWIASIVLLFTGR